MYFQVAGFRIISRMKNSRFAHSYVPPAVFALITLFVLNFVSYYALDKENE